MAMAGAAWGDNNKSTINKLTSYGGICLTNCRKGFQKNLNNN